ncbi:uncharacterized protein LOC134823352 [Bolinopsis microptera]|uniref:uncharacterized protein LOC134823352 n=1 Tax=Bolinopsis microptera TaxID=2820187 RepID=UPI003079B502
MSQFLVLSLILGVAQSASLASESDNALADGDECLTGYNMRYDLECRRKRRAAAEEAEKLELQLADQVVEEGEGRALVEEEEEDLSKRSADEQDWNYSARRGRGKRSNNEEQDYGNYRRGEKRSAEEQDYGNYRRGDSEDQDYGNYRRGD